MIAYVAGLRLLDEGGIAAVKIFAEALGGNHRPFLLVFQVALLTFFYNYTLLK